jgi:hypothetical protein
MSKRVANTIKQVECNSADDTQRAGVEYSKPDKVPGFVEISNGLCKDFKDRPVLAQFRCV